MTEIEVLNEIRTLYSDKSLNESDTRFKIIDRILCEVLKWPRDPIITELYIDGNRADYLLKGKNENPLLVIESKKNEIYFELPNGANGSNTFQKVIVEKLITDNNIKDAIYQVKEYAEDLLCQFAAICNGKTWIIFRVNSNLKPWKKLPAVVIKNIDFFIDSYTQAINILGYKSVTESNSLNQYVGVSKKTFLEIFYPKNSITGYNTKVNSNKYAGPLSSLSRKYLGVIPENDSEFMNHCYVSNRGLDDGLQKDVQGVLHDSLTPYFKNLGFRDFTIEDKGGGAFGVRIAKIIKQERLDNVMILFGGRGAGKSTFLKRFLFHVKPIEISMYGHVALIGLLNSSQTAEELTKEIWEKLLNGIDKEGFRKGTREQLLTLFHEEFEIYQKQILQGLQETSSEYQKLLRDFIINKTSDLKLFSEKISLHWKNKNKGLVIFLDNMDQLPPDLQDVCFRTAAEISERLGCLTIVSMREERYYNAKSRGVLDAYQNPGFHLASPVIPEVIIKRIEYIIDKLKFTQDVDTEYGIKDVSELNTLIAFFEICNSQLKRKSSPLSFFLRYATHGDVRQALNFFEGFLTSGYTNISEMAPHPDWVFQVHQVIKPMMIPARFFYDEMKSKIPNLYQLRNDTDSSHFTGLRILNALQNRKNDKLSNGFIDVKFFIQSFDEKYSSKEDTIKHLQLYLEKGIIESNNRLEEYSDEIDQIKITALGSYIFTYLAFNFAYLDLVCIDCALFNETLNNYLVKSASKELEFYYDRDFMSRIHLRLERVDKFVQYLTDLEIQEFFDLGLEPTEIKFTDRLKKSIIEQKKRVIKSATNKQRLENEFN